MNLQAIAKVANYLGIKADKLSVTDDQVLKVCVGGKEYTGLATVLLALASTSKEPAKWSTKEQEAAVYQWLEFASLYGQTMKTISHQTKNILKELNKYLENCSYLVGYAVTLADVIIYHTVYEIVDALTLSDRESYLDLCRWFDHIQQDKKVRQENTLINFSTTYISSRLASGY